MGWPYAYARGLTNIQMTKTGLTFFFLPQERLLYDLCPLFSCSQGT